jgi:hypothetical protein
MVVDDSTHLVLNRQVLIRTQIELKRSKHSVSLLLPFPKYRGRYPIVKLRISRRNYATQVIQSFAVQSNLSLIGNNPAYRVTSAHETNELGGEDQRGGQLTV